MRKYKDSSTQPPRDSMSTPTHRAAGRPSGTILTSERITEAACRLLKKHGGFTMSSLAKKLNVAASSLYNHVDSRDEVLANISDHVVREISVQPLLDAVTILHQTNPAPGAASILWIEATAQWARSYANAFAATPEVVAHLAITPVRRAPRTLAMYEQVVSAFIEFGFAPAHALSTVEALEAFLLGSALDATAPADIFDPAELSKEHPAMAAAYRELSAAHENPAQLAFETGLYALLGRFSATTFGAQLI